MWNRSRKLFSFQCEVYVFIMSLVHIDIYTLAAEIWNDKYLES